jgi:ADP-ribose pyrophosphatase YjhB (NUDIX family)
MTSDRRYPPRPVVGVGMVIVVSDRDRAAIGYQPDVPSPAGVVLVKRKYEPLAGEWSLPGGAQEIGETLEEAAAREALEETGLAIDVGPIVEVFDRIVRDHDGRVEYHYVLVDYVCRPKGGRLQAGSDVSDTVIADPMALEQYGLTEKAGTVISRAMRMSFRLKAEATEQ